MSDAFCCVNQRNGYTQTQTRWYVVECTLYPVLIYYISVSTERVYTTKTSSARPSLLRREVPVHAGLVWQLYREDVVVGDLSLDNVKGGGPRIGGTQRATRACSAPHTGVFFKRVDESFDRCQFVHSKTLLTK